MILLALLAACGDRCAELGNICTVAGTGLAGLGAEGVPADESHLYLPQDLGFGPDGNAYLLDWNNHRIRRIDAEGIVQTIAGSGFLGDGPEGPALAAAFNHPTNLVFDGSGDLIVAAWHNSRVEKIDLATGTVEFLCGTGQRGYNGSEIPADTAVLDLPSSVALDAQGRLFLSDQANQQIRMVDGEGLIHDVVGQQRVTGYAGDGGPASAALLHASVGQAADPANRIVIDDEVMYIADTGNHVIRAVDLASFTIETIAGSRACDGDGVCTPVAGSGGDGGPALGAELDGPTDVAVGRDGTIYIADTGNHCVRAIDPSGTLDTVAGVCGQDGFDGDGGPASEALLTRPYGVALDRDGDLWIADTWNHVYRRVTLSE